VDLGNFSNYIPKYYLQRYFQRKIIETKIVEHNITKKGAVQKIPKAGKSFRAKL